MPITHPFEYVRPDSLAEVLSILAKHGRKAMILAGGTDLVVHLKEDRATPDVVVDVKGLPELRGIRVSQGKATIGALATFTDILESKELREHSPLLVESAHTVASVGIRNRATLVGSLCSAVPSLDCGPALLVYDALVLTKSSDACSAGERSLSIHDWFTGPKKTALRDHEMATAVTFEPPTAKHASVYVKLGRYAGEDLAQAGIAVLLTQDREYRVAFCALGPVAKRARRVEALLKGKDLSADLIKQARRVIVDEISPITDIRASQEYRTLMAQVMIERALTEVTARLRGHTTPSHTLLGG